MQPDLQHGGDVLLFILPHVSDPDHTTEPREIPYAVDLLSRTKDQYTKPLHERSP
jgi:hypothetical protein